MVKGFRITVVVPVFNTELYLGETLECIQSQSIGFDNIQLILINDGSTDGSSEICRKFWEKHKANVVYKDLSLNQGVSHARNIGLNMAEGKYITFWDADDLWSLDALEKAVRFMDEHETEVDIVCSNLEFFDGDSGGHQTNFKLSKSQVINIYTNYNKIRNTMGGVAAIKTDIAREYQFDETHKYWEDAKYINSIILRKQQYGMLADAIYYYRVRRTGDSAAQVRAKIKDFYLHDLNGFFEGIYRETMKHCGEFIPMMQYLMAYTLGIYFQQNEAAILGKEELAEYHEVLRRILVQVEDDYLKEIINVNDIVKCRMRAFKCGLDMPETVKLWEQKEREASNLHNRLGRTTANYNILKKWFELKQKGVSVLDFFYCKGYQKIAIYGMSDLGRYLYEELSGSQIEVAYAIDRRAEKLDFNLPILKVEDALPPVDVIIVTAVYYFEQINELLRDKTDCPVVSIEDIVEGMSVYRKA